MSLIFLIHIDLSAAEEDSTKYNENYIFKFLLGPRTICAYPAV